MFSLSHSLSAYSLLAYLTHSVCWLIHLSSVLILADSFTHSLWLANWHFFFFLENAPIHFLVVWTRVPLHQYCEIANNYFSLVLGLLNYTRRKKSMKGRLLLVNWRDYWFLKAVHQEKGSWPPLIILRESRPLNTQARTEYAPSIQGPGGIVYVSPKKYVFGSQSSSSPLTFTHGRKLTTQDVYIRSRSPVFTHSGGFRKHRMNLRII